MDNRLFRRRASAIDFRAFDAGSGRFLGRIGDLSPGGFLLYGAERLPTGSLQTIRIDYPNEQGGLHSARFQARAMWSGADVNPALFATGFRFYELDAPDVRAALDELLNRFTVSDEIPDEE